MIRVAIVGCGKIADSHAGQLRRIKDAEIVAACDQEPLMVEQFCDRFDVRQPYTDLDTLIQRSRPSVVHITTPPQSHYRLAKVCLESGCHVYVEKPFTLNSCEAEELIRVAIATGCKLTVGHDAQFSHAAVRMRELVSAGYLGGAPIHIESYYCYPFGSDAYGAALLGDRAHWVRDLPGKLLQNVISHAVSAVAEFLASDCPDVTALGFSSPFLQRIGAADVVDEVRVIVRDPGGLTAYITLSSQMRPPLHQLRIYGPRNGLMVDDDKQMVFTLRGASYTSYLEKFVPPITLAGQCLRNAAFNLGKFLQNDFHMKSGMKTLIERFYASIREGTALPVPYREVLLTSQIVDSIICQVYGVGKERGIARAPVGVVLDTDEVVVN